MPSVRRRLLLVLATGFTVLIAGAGLGLSGVVSARLTDEFDVGLLAKATALEALTEQEGGRIELDYTKEAMPEFEREKDPEHFQFWLDDGTPLLRSKRLTADLPRRGPLAPGPWFSDAALPDGRAGRVVQIAYVPRKAGAEDDAPAAFDPEVIGAATGTRAVVLAVARGRGGLDATIAGIRTAILGVGLAAVLVALLLVWRALAAGFRPIDEIAAQVGALGAEKPGARVGLARAPRELAGVVEQVNALLARLEAALARERRFTGNVAHEMKTPIAELRSLAAVGARWPDDPASVAQFFDDVEQIAARMEGVVADLLLLARCQAGVERTARSRTDLAEVVASAWAGHAKAASQAGLSYRAEIPDDLALETDPGKLSIVLSNLLGNAVAHARPGGDVACVARAEGGRFTLEVSNPAEPLSEQDMAHLTEPFWRRDAARTSGEHAGLGLALVSALAGLLGLEVRFAQAPDGTFRARVEGRTTPTSPVLSGT